MSSSKILRGDASRAATPIPWAGAARATPAKPVSTHSTAAHQEITDIEEQLRRAHAAGIQEGRAAAEQTLKSEVRGAVERLGRAVAELAGHKGRLRRDAERDTVMLALEIARRVLHREISADPEALVGLVKTALEKMDARDLNRVRVHPDYAGAVDAVLKAIGSPQRIEVVPDRTLEIGGVIFETARGSYDASVTTQLAEIEKGFAEIVQRRQ
jgi:flagellar assembly protein FliH